MQQLAPEEPGVILPTPERIERGASYWYVWFVVQAGSGREYRLVMVAL